ncbi:MAG: hypothetical protein NUV56_01215, partial [Candidatus Uhrbacteria bacterium]|nr:hypothetical protein [Candidatus Uhrbacteria bacterium]
MPVKPEEYFDLDTSPLEAVVGVIDANICMQAIRAKGRLSDMVSTDFPCELTDEMLSELHRIYRRAGWLASDCYRDSPGSPTEFRLFARKPEVSWLVAVAEYVGSDVGHQDDARERGEVKVTTSHAVELTELDELQRRVLAKLELYGYRGWKQVVMEVVN